MIKAFVSDFSRVLLSPKNESYTEGLNALHKKLSADGDYDFWSYFRLNHDLVTLYKTLGKIIDMYLFTTEYIQEHPALKPALEDVFKKVFSGTRLDLKKTDVQAYKTIANEIGLKPKEILYMDDNQVNLDAAKKAGMFVIRYESNEQAMEDIGKVLEAQKN